MLTLDFYNPAALPPARALLQVLRLAFHWRSSVVFGCHRDDIATRRERTRKGAIEVELCGDGSGLEVAAFGWWLLVGVELKRGHAVGCSYLRKNRVSRPDV